MHTDTGITIGSNTATGDITFYLNDYDINNSPTFQTTGTVTFVPYTPTNTVSAGYASGTAQTNFNTDILSAVHDDVSKIVIGASDGTSYDGDITIDPSYDWDTAGNDRALDILSDQGNVLLSTNDSIIFNNASAPLSIITQGGDITFTSDADGNGDGAILLNTATLTSNGGNITLGGGYDPDGVGGTGCWDGADCTANFARGISGTNGIGMSDTTISSASGNIDFYGMGVDSESLLSGIDINGTSSINTSTGDITIYGIGGKNGAHFSNGVRTFGSGVTVSTASGQLILQGLEEKVILVKEILLIEGYLLMEPLAQ